jgi:hypothetical protein
MSDQEKFIADLYPAAAKVSQETGMSKELILAQASEETGWGQHVLPGTNNIFNIKASPDWHGPTKTFNVWEIEGGKKVWKDQEFRVYGSAEEALRDRVKFLEGNPRYAKAGLFDEGTKGHQRRSSHAAAEPEQAGLYRRARPRSQARQRFRGQYEISPWRPFSAIITSRQTASPVQRRCMPFSSRRRSARPPDWIVPRTPITRCTCRHKRPCMNWMRVRDAHPISKATISPRH